MKQCTVSALNPPSGFSDRGRESNSAATHVLSRLKRPLAIGPQGALPAALIIVVLLQCMASFVFFPLYNTNDDVAIRLVLEGRIAPGAEPSGYAFFINLALGQAIAALYRLLPSVHWYDLAEHGTLWLSSTVALYCGIRRIRSYSDVAFVILIASVFLTALVTVQFSIVATLSTSVGATATLFALRMPTARSETTALAFSGTALIVLGCLFRLEAGLLSLFAIAIVWGLSALQLPRERPFRRPRLLLIPIAGLALVAAAWLYHSLTLAASPAWQDFFTFNIERARLVEYFASRLDRSTLAQAYHAAGWSIAEHDLLFNWLFIDERFFNVETLRAVLSHLPDLPSSTAIENPELLLSSYVAPFPFIGFALIGVALYETNVRTTAFVSLATFALAACVITITILLKPLGFRVFWPLACGSLIALWMFARSDVTGRWHRLITLLIAPVVGLSFLWAAFLIVQTDWLTIAHRTNWTRDALADLRALALPRDTTAVVFGADLPFEAIERPFGPPIIQRRLNVLPLGTLVLSPVMAPLVKRLATPDIASWMCSDATVLISRGPGLLAAYYPRRRHYEVNIERSFSGKTFSAYRCRRAPAAASH